MLTKPKLAAAAAGLLFLSAYPALSASRGKLVIPCDALCASKAGISAQFRTIIKPGEAPEFWMGSPESEAGRRGGEALHRVRLTQPYELQATHVTNEQLAAILQRPFDGPRRLLRHPAVNVSALEAEEAIGVLNTIQRKYTYALPTEAQYEYAARGGAKNPNNLNSPYFFGSDAKKLGRFAWFSGNSKGTRTVATRQPNPLGLFDIVGNVWQWMKDPWGANYGLKDLKATAVDPVGPGAGSFRVVRGGSFVYSARYLRSAFRINDFPGYRYGSIGFRLLRFIR